MGTSSSKAGLTSPLLALGTWVFSLEDSEWLLSPTHCKPHAFLSCFPSSPQSVYRASSSGWGQRLKASPSFVETSTSPCKDTSLLAVRVRGEGGPGLASSRSQPWAKNLCLRSLLGKPPAAALGDQRGSGGSKPRKGQKPSKTRSSYGEIWCVKRTLEYVPPQGQGAGLLELLVKVTEWGRGTKTPRHFWNSVRMRQSSMGLYTDNPLHGESYRLPLAAKPAEAVQWGSKKDPRWSYGGATMSTVGTLWG